MLLECLCIIELQSCVRKWEMNNNNEAYIGGERNERNDAPWSPKLQINKSPVTNANRFECYFFLIVCHLFNRNLFGSLCLVFVGKMNLSTNNYLKSEWISIWRNIWGCNQTKPHTHPLDAKANAIHICVFCWKLSCRQYIQSLIQYSEPSKFVYLVFREQYLSHCLFRWVLSHWTHINFSLRRSNCVKPHVNFPHMATSCLHSEETRTIGEPWWRLRQMHRFNFHLHSILVRHLLWMNFPSDAFLLLGQTTTKNIGIFRWLAIG